MAQPPLHPSGGAAVGQEAMEHWPASSPLSALPDELWLEIIGYLDQDVAACMLPYVCRHLWQLLRKPSRVWRSVDIGRLRAPAIRRPHVLAGVCSAMATCTWVRARGAAVESLSIERVQFGPACVLVTGLLGCALPGLTSFKLAACGREPSHLAFTASSPWLCVELGGCRGLREVTLHWDFAFTELGSAVQWAQLRQLTKLDFRHERSDDEQCLVPVPACFAGLPCLRSLGLAFVDELCFAGWACQGVLQSLELHRCWPAERGFALQALPSLTSLVHSGELQLLPSSLRALTLLGFWEGELAQASVACVRSSLQTLVFGHVHGFPAGVTGLSDLRHLELCFCGELREPAGLQACAKLTAFWLHGSFRAVLHFEELDLRGFPCLQELRVKDCRLFCGGLLVNAARLPLLRLVEFQRAYPASDESAEAVLELGLALQGLGKGGVLRIEPA